MAALNPTPYLPCPWQHSVVGRKLLHKVKSTAERSCASPQVHSFRHDLAERPDSTGTQDKKGLLVSCLALVFSTMQMVVLNHMNSW